MKHIAIFDNMEDVQTALNEEVLVKPYVALVDGALDYNTMEPEEPCSLGVWSDDGEGTYTFQITDTDPNNWYQSVKIGVLLGIYADGNHDDFDVQLCQDPTSNDWQMDFYLAAASNTPQYTFEEGVPDTWNNSGAMTDPDDSDAVINVSWNGIDTFVFNSGGDLHPLSMTTISPCE